MKILQILLSLICGVLTMNLSAASYFQTDSLIEDKTLVKSITGISKKHNHLNINFNTRFSFHGKLDGTDGDKTTFRADLLRLQVTGNISNHISYKWLQRLNANNGTGNLDNMLASTDCLGIGFRISPRFTVFAGKQYVDYGGFEYDADPALVYEYSDFGNYITCCLVGAHIEWEITPSHELRFQIVNARSSDAETTYGIFPIGFQPASVPLGYTINWNGNMFDKRLQTRCSFTLFHEGTDENVYLLAIGTAWSGKHIDMYTDVMYSAEDIDKLGIISEMPVFSQTGIRANNCRYLSVISRLNIHPCTKWNLFLKGFYETASIHQENGAIVSGNYRTTYGYQGGVEYFPTGDNFRLFLLYRGKDLCFSQAAKKTGTIGSRSQFLSVGLIYNLPIF